MQLSYSTQRIVDLKCLNSCYDSTVELGDSELFGSMKRQKIEPVPIPLPRASRNFPDVKQKTIFFFHNWTSEIIPYIRFGMQMDGT